jgi:hypothetical protein
MKGGQPSMEPNSTPARLAPGRTEAAGRAGESRKAN